MINRYIITALFIIIYINISIGQNKLKYDYLAAHFTQQWWVNDDPSNAILSFDENLSKTWKPGRLKDLKKSIIAKNGISDSIGNVLVLSSANTLYTFQPIYFNKSIYQILLKWNTSGQIVDIKVNELLSDSFNPLLRNNILDFSFIQLTGADGFGLKGMLIAPKSKTNFPLMVMVHGSGPNDMFSSAGSHKPFLEIAHSFVQKGIGVLIYDKRTYTFKDPADYPTLTPEQETIADAVAIINQARSFKNVNPDSIIAFGHSLGAYLMPDIVSKINVNSIVMLAPAYNPLWEVMERQFKYLRKYHKNLLPENIYKQQIKIINTIKNKQYKATDAAVNLMGAPMDYWNWMHSYDIKRNIDALNIRSLVVFGDQDYQVYKPELKAWIKATKRKPNVKIVVLKGLNHIMKPCTYKQGPSCYGTFVPISQNFTDLVTRWILGN